ncbi:glycosidase, partial [Chloroflexota bacterium]
LPLEPLVVSYEDFSMLALPKEPSILSKLSGSLLVSSVRRGEGGKFPKLRYFLMMVKNIVEAERFGEIWEQFARERKEFGAKVVNSLKGHWGRDPLSAHNMFESKIQGILVERVRKMIRDLETKEDPSLSRLIQSLSYIMDCYHLALSLPDGKFIPCSAWTWASYSFKGGKGIPTSLSLHVERDWASREFLVEMVTSLGVSEENMDSSITELMGHGRESENLARLLLPGWQTAQQVIPEQMPRPAEPEAGKLRRFEENPILKAIPEHPWESKYVFNPGAIMLEGKIYILYRACGEDEVSRIGLAVSSDGFHIEERLESPVFEPDGEWETRGCEDPRLILIGERIYMLYTAYNSVTAQIALASIGPEDFLNRRWNKWRRHGLAFPGLDDKDATVFPEAFNGRYAMYHRIEPSIWISYSERLDCPWSREDHRILAGPGAGMAWDGLKIGGGSQPIRTKYGWLLIYHGVDHSFLYRLGVLLVALDDPGQLLYRSPNPVLEPEESYELGEEGRYVPNVVFSCGAVPQMDKGMLDDDDEILVYYGAADTTSCVAIAKVSDLIPKEIRQGKNRGGYLI